MEKLKTYIPVIISIFISLIVMFLVGNNYQKEPAEIYKVYVDGNLIGAIRSKRALENYINREQAELKKEYGVKKVYIPNGIDIEKAVTYDGDFYTEKEMYKIIKQRKNFTIKGYMVTISSDNDEIEDKIIYVVNKNIFDTAVKKVLNSFVSEEQVKAYLEDKQPEIKTTGSIIENIYLGQDVNIKAAYISTDELIFKSELSLVRYLLFGSLNPDEEYVVQPGDTISTVAFNNKLSTEEFLIVNPEFTSENNLLSIGQVVNVSLIEPMLDFVVEKHVVEDVEKPFETVEKDDDSLYVGQTKVETEGVPGVQRIQEKVKYINGQTQQGAVILPGAEVIKEPINKVVLKGTKMSAGGYSNAGSPPPTSGNWGWPTIYPYVITDYYGWRWGRMHNAIDISGCGFGSPIYSISDGVVLKVSSGCADNGYYGSSCGGGYGNYIWIQHKDNIYAVYAHLATLLLVSPGDTVSKGEMIGYMANSGSSTGTHLHFGVYYGGPEYAGGSSFNPFSLY